MAGSKFDRELRRAISEAGLTVVDSCDAGSGHRSYTLSDGEQKVRLITSKTGEVNALNAAKRDVRKIAERLARNRRRRC